MKSIILLTSLTLYSFQVSATVCNGGFEDGMSCWGGLTETFGFAEVVSSYTDGAGTAYAPTEGTLFLNFWGTEDRAQSLSWSIGDQISFDYATVEGANPSTSDATLFFGLFDGLSPLGDSFHLGSPDSNFQTFTHTFTQDSPLDGLIVFQALGTMPGFGLTNQDVGHVLIDNIQFSAVPLPTALFMFAPALAGLLGLRRKRNA